ncbi:MAG: glycosyltransferase [Candidatus Cloacimonetes bacterium]|nr:glycosyltransferase [Candidatus Cloacimonadota bacterium]
MPEKYNLLTFSDVPIPSYTRPYRGVLFVDYAPNRKIENVYVISSESREKFKNKRINLHTDYFSATDFKSNQYNLYFRLSNIFKLFLKLFKFRLQKAHKIGFIRTGSTYLSFLVLLTQKTKTPYFADICDFYFDLYQEFKMPLASFLKPLIFFFEKLALQRANLLFVDTAVQRRYQVQKLGVDARKCVVIPNGVILDNYPFSLKKDENVLRDYNFSPLDKILFYGGDISEADGVEMIIKFIQESKDKNVKALIIGKGKAEYLEGLKDKIAQLGLTNRVYLDSFKPYNKLHKYISIADVCLAPFRLTPTSNTVECAKIITYLLMGKPCLATEAEGIKSLYKDKVTYFRDGDFNGFSSRLHNLLENPIAKEESLKLRSLGEKFDFKKIIEHEYFIIDQYFKNPKQDFSKYDYL